jgi:hypothetical protein
MMTRRDFELLADAIASVAAEAMTVEDDFIIECLTERIMRVCKLQNPRFEAKAFLAWIRLRRSELQRAEAN